MLDRLRRLLHGLAVYLLFTIPVHLTLMILEWLADWVAFLVVSFCLAVVYLCVFSQWGQSAFARTKIKQPVRAAWLTMVIVGCLLIYPYFFVRDWAYQTGRFGEPPNNRYIAIHEATPSHILLEFGVRTTPLEGFEVVLKFSSEMCTIPDGKIGGPGPPNSPNGPFKLTIGFSNPSRDDRNVYIANPGCRVTPRESVYYELRPKESESVLHDCRFQGPDESFEEGASCTKGEVEVIDLSGRMSYVPVPFESDHYSVDELGCL